MIRSLIPAAAALLLLLSCQGEQGAEDPSTPAPADTNWMGETQITRGDTVVMLCGTGHRYHVTGPAIDTLSKRYTYFRTRAGQWVKTWFMGHLAPVMRNGLQDTMLVVTKVMHMDGGLHCDPIPNARMSGRYGTDFQDPQGSRSMQLQLFPNGDVTMITDFHNGIAPLEEDGVWGTDPEGHVQVKWPTRDQTMYLQWEQDRLVSDMKLANGSVVVLPKLGPADRMIGQYGRTVRWLAAVASANGHPVEADAIQPSTTIAELFPTEASKAALQATLADTLGLDAEGIRLQWAAASTVKHAAQLMRARSRQR
jgi:hypothetical protein